MNRVALFIVILVFCGKAFADAVDQTLIFEDKYIGYLINYNHASTITAYQQANLDSKIAEPVHLLHGCTIGSSSDCTDGTPYKKISEDKSGNIFYLVKTEQKQAVWILPPHNSQTGKFEIDVNMGGSEVIFSEAHAQTNTDIQDKVPSVRTEQIAAFKKMDAALSHLRGNVDITLTTETHFKIWPSSVKPPSNSILISKENLVALGEQKEGNILRLEFLRATGNYLLIKGSGTSEKIFTSASGMDYENTYFWLDVSNLRTSKEVTAPDFDSSYYDPLILTQSEGVEKIQTFNGNQYALISTYYSAIDPDNFNKTENTFANLTFSVPLYWAKIRDANGKLRFWFELYTGG